jgi:hypothetical protein
VRWIRRFVPNDDGKDPAVGIPAADVSLSRLPPSSDFRLALLDEAGGVVSSIDLSRGDLHDMRGAITNVMRVVR